MLRDETRGGGMLFDDLAFHGLRGTRYEVLPQYSKRARKLERSLSM